MARELTVWLPREPSRGLATAIDQVARDVAPSPGPGIIAEAEQRARYLRRELQRRDAQIAARWLAELGDMVPNAPTREVFAEKAPKWIATLDLPPLAYTRETLIEAARRFRFWPSVAELAESLMPRVNAVTAEAIACERIARSRIPEPVEPPTEADLARVRVLVADTTAELRAREQERQAQIAASRPPPRQPRPLTREQLIAGYRERGLPLPPWLARGEAAPAGGDGS